MEPHDDFGHNVDYTLYCRRSHGRIGPITVDLSRYPQRTLALHLEQKTLATWLLNRDRVRSEPHVRSYATWERHPLNRLRISHTAKRRR